MQREQRPLVELEQHIHQLCLRHLIGADRAIELDARLGVVERGLVAAARGAHRAPNDAVTRLIQTGERRAQTVRERQQRVGREGGNRSGRARW